MTAAKADRPPDLLAGLLESTIERGARARFEVDGHSMLPLIRPGDVVRVEPANCESGRGTRVGDVVAVRAAPGAGLLLHRVIRRRAGRMLVRGDNNFRADGEYDEGEIIGVVRVVERDDRRVWFGAGMGGGVVAALVRAGVVYRVNRTAYAAYRALGKSLRRERRR